MLCQKQNPSGLVMSWTRLPLVSILTYRFSGSRLSFNVGGWLPPLQCLILFLWLLVEDEWLQRAKEHSLVVHSREGGGGVQNTENIALFRMFPFVLLCSLFSIYDVDFIIWFLKRWYFFRKTKSSHSECLFVGKCLNLLLTHVIFERKPCLHQVFTSPWDLFINYCLKCWWIWWRSLKSDLKGLFFIKKQTFLDDSKRSFPYLNF